MALTKSDLFAIRRIFRGEVKTETASIKSDLKIVKKDVKSLDSKFTKLFDFIDKDWSKLKKRVDVYHPAN